jgi:hypothetical protein
MNHILNINFSVSLYDNIFNLLGTLQEEKDIYQKVKEYKKDTVSPLVHQRDIQFNPSQFYIKNSTGELLLFRTAK